MSSMYIRPGKYAQSREALPDNREGKWCVDVDEQRSYFVQIMENKAVSPSNNRTGKWTMRQAITGKKQCWTWWEEPEEDEV